MGHGEIYLNVIVLVVQVQPDGRNHLILKHEKKGWFAPK